MPRPSLKAERRAQILTAFGRCLARYGFEGASLERVAEEAGLARALIRHNIGNRDQLIDAFVTEFLERSRADTAALVAGLPKTGRVKRLIEDLFDPDYIDAEGAAIGSALLAAVDLHPGLSAAMLAWNGEFMAALAQILSSESTADAQALREVAAGLAALYANVEAMAAIDRQGTLRADSQRAALRLVATLPGLEALGRP